MLPADVTYVGALLQFHVILHTWYYEGVIILDLLVSGTGSLMHMMPITERLFEQPDLSGGSFWLHNM